MTDFFANLEGLKKKISRKAGKTVDIVAKKTGEAVDIITKKAEETVEITKIKSQISTMERNNERDYKDIGKMIYEKYKKGEEIDGEYVELCEVISEREDRICKAKEEIAKVKGLEVCPQCEARFEAGTYFCPKCGVNLEGKH